MQITNKKLDFYIIILSVLMLAGVVLRSVASILFLDFEYGYYDKSVLISVASWVVGVGSLFLLTYLFLPDKTRYHEDFTTAETYIPTALVGASLIYFAYDMFIGRVNTAPQALFSDAENILSLICAIFALLSVAYFFLNTFIKNLRSDIRATASFMAIIFLCIYPTYLYFNTDLPINAPVKITDQMAYLLSAVFFLYESRISLGREKWRAYIAFGMVSSLLCAYSSIPSLIVYFRTGHVISGSIAESVLTFTLFIFISARILLIRELKSEEKCELALDVEKHFYLRHSELGEDLLELARRNEPTQLALQFNFDTATQNEDKDAKDTDSKQAKSEDSVTENEDDASDSLSPENDESDEDNTTVIIDLFDLIDKDASANETNDSYIKDDSITPQTDDSNAEGDDNK